MKKKTPAAAVDTHKAVSVYITRDSDAFGVLSDRVDVWTMKPFRTKLTNDAGHVWLPVAAKGELEDDADELGHVRSLPVKYAKERYGTIPDTDLEFIKCMVLE